MLSNEHLGKFSIQEKKRLKFGKNKIRKKTKLVNKIVYNRLNTQIQTDQWRIKGQKEAEENVLFS